MPYGSNPLDPRNPYYQAACLRHMERMMKDHQQEASWTRHSDGCCHRTVLTRCSDCPFRPISNSAEMHPQEIDPTGRDPHRPGAKLDAGKSPVRRGLLEYFPRACMAVADVSAHGAAKYTWGGWRTVPEGVDRYGDAGVRHICKRAIEGENDPDSLLLHAAHEAWNAMARLELVLRGKSLDDETLTSTFGPLVIDTARRS